MLYKKYLMLIKSFSNRLCYFVHYIRKTFDSIKLCWISSYKRTLLGFKYWSAACCTAFIRCISLGLNHSIYLYLFVYSTILSAYFIKGTDKKNTQTSCRSHTYRQSLWSYVLRLANNMNLVSLSRLVRVPDFGNAPFKELFMIMYKFLMAKWKIL
jgi:hypothetical protein